ncbi:ArdC-like ssDNA-binding domain-containing protein [Actinoallomurus vinaceus]
MAELKAAMMSPEETEHFTHFAAMLGEKYSLRNRFLIWIQRPTATHVAAKSTWSDDYGRRISGGKGCGIAIVAPLTRKADKEEGGPKGKDEPQKKDEREIWGVKVTYVYDIADTSPADDQAQPAALPAVQPAPRPEASEVTDMLTTILEDKHSERTAAEE